MVTSCCRKWAPFQGHKSGLLSNTWKKNCLRRHVLTKQETLLEEGTQVESSRIREPRRTALLRGSPLWVLCRWGQFPGCVWPIILAKSPSWWCTHQSAKMDASERDSGRWTDRWCLLLTFPELFRLAVSYQFHVPYQDLLS